MTESLDAVLLSVGNLVTTTIQKAGSVRELNDDSQELPGLLNSVTTVVHNQAKEVGVRQLQEAVLALKGLEECLKQCAEIVSNISTKSSIVKFLRAGMYLTDINAIACHLVRWLDMFEFVVCAQHESALREESSTPRKAWWGLKLTVLQDMAEQAAVLRSVVESRVSGSGEDEAELRKLAKEILQQAGVMADGSHTSAESQSKVDGVLAAAVASIHEEAEELRKRDQAAEGDYLAAVADMLLASSVKQEHEAAVDACTAMLAAVCSMQKSFVCPITLEVMREPVILVESGHTYEQEAIEKYLARNHKDPITNVPLRSKVFVPNLTLKAAIKDWQQKEQQLGGSRMAAVTQQTSQTAEQGGTSIQETKISVDDAAAASASATAPVTIMAGHTSSVLSVTWSPDGRKLASGSDDWSIRVWDATSGACVATLEGHTSSVKSLAWSPDGRKLASGSWDSSIRVWDATSGACVATLKGHTNAVMSVAWSPDGRKLASGSADKSMRAWDATSGACVATLKRHTNYVNSVAWSPDGRKLASGSSDKSIRVWDATSGACVATLKGHTYGVYSVAWSPDGRKLTSGSADESIRVWDATSGTCVATLEGQTRSVLSVVWSPDGRKLASGSADKSIRVWDATSGACVATMEGHNDIVFSVAWSPDGRKLASGSVDKSIRVWDAISGACVATL